MNDALLVQWPVIDLKRLYVPTNQCVLVAWGPVGHEVIDSMQERNYDFAPVAGNVEGGQTVIGLMSRERLQQLADAGTAVAPDDPEIDTGSRVMPEPPLDELLTKMADCPAVMVVDYLDLDHEQLPIRYGLLTRADLNKHPLRHYLYPILAELENRLTRLIGSCCHEAWDWLKHLSDDSKVRILGSLELARRNGVEPDEGPLAFAMLSDLLTVAAKSPEVEDRVGGEFRQLCNQARYDLADLRNRVMHVVRPLVCNGQEVTRLRESIGVAIALANRLTAYAQ